MPRRLSDVARPITSLEGIEGDSGGRARSVTSAHSVTLDYRGPKDTSPDPKVTHAHAHYATSV